MSRSLDAARSFLEQLEARGGREGAVLAGEFSVSGRVGRQRAALRLLALDAPLSVALSPCLSSPSASRVPEGDVHGRVGRDRASPRVPAPSPRSRNRPVAEQGGRSPALDTRRPAAPGDQAATPVVVHDIMSIRVWVQSGTDIRARSASWKTDSVCSTEAGSRPENVRKNRYKDVLPYDQTRVILSLLQEEGHGDYINGNFIRKKCERYWAQEQEPLQIGLFCITLRGLWANRCPVHRGLCETVAPDPGMKRAYKRSMIPPNFSLFNVVLEIRRQRPAAIQTEEQYRFLYHTVAQMFLSVLQNASPRYQNLKENCAPLYDDAFSLRTSHTLPAIARPSGGVLRSISVPGPPGLAMADTYAVVQKRAAPAGTGAGAGARARGAEETPLYSQVTPRARRPQAHAEDGREPLPGRVLPGHAPEADVLASPATPLGQPPVLWSRPEASRAKPRSLARPPSLGGGLRFGHAPGHAPSRWAPALGPQPAFSGLGGCAFASQRLSGTSRGGLSRPVRGGFLPAVPVDQSPAGPGAYEDVVDGAQTGGLGFNLRIGRPKGPRDPPAEWTRV
eukprot:bmy_14948T0